MVYLKKLPERKKIPDDDYRIYKELYDANTGISGNERCFSAPPLTGKEKQLRMVKVGLQNLTLNTMVRS